MTLVASGGRGRPSWRRDIFGQNTVMHKQNLTVFRRNQKKKDLAHVTLLSKWNKLHQFTENNYSYDLKPVIVKQELKFDFAVDEKAGDGGP